MGWYKFKTKKIDQSEAVHFWFGDRCCRCTLCWRWPHGYYVLLFVCVMDHLYMNEGGFSCGKNNFVALHFPPTLFLFVSFFYLENNCHFSLPFCYSFVKYFVMMFVCVCCGPPVYNYRRVFVQDKKNFFLYLETNVVCCCLIYTHSFSDKMQGSADRTARPRAREWRLWVCVRTGMPCMCTWVLVCLFFSCTVSFFLLSFLFIYLLFCFCFCSPLVLLFAPSRVPFWCADVLLHCRQDMRCYAAMLLAVLYFILLSCVFVFVLCIYAWHIVCARVCVYIYI